MNSLFLDWETYWDKDFTLRKMSPAEYILDYRFEALGCAFIWNDTPAIYVDGPDVPDYLAQVPWEDTYAVSHNALFDACILKWRYNVNPKMLGDTMAMARNWWFHSIGYVSLAKVSEYLGIAPKMLTVQRTLGKRYSDIVANPMLHKELGRYGIDDVTKCKTIFKELMLDGFPAAELSLIDRQVRMATNPKFIIDQDVLQKYLAKVVKQKSDILAKIDMELGDIAGLMSNDKLALLLLANGVEPPRKVSKTTGLETWAFSKADEEFTDLLDHWDPQVQAIITARLAVKSTIEETRTQRFINIGNLEWPEWENEQSLPIPLKYSGAHTKRFSGDWLMNAQNLGRNSDIRHAIKAPEGKKVVAADASQIECRFLMEFARQIAVQRGHPHSDMLEKFRRGIDVYADFISGVYQKHINKQDSPDERFQGKVGVLSLGFGASWPVLQGMIRVQSNGTTMVSDKEAILIVKGYRERMPEVPLLWSEADRALYFMAKAGPDEWMQFGPLWLGRDVAVLPNGNRINYKGLHQEVSEKDGRRRWWYYFGQRKKMLYGAKFVENFIQAMDFMHVMEADARVATATDGLIELAHQVHDELIYVVENRHADAVGDLVARELARSPAYWPDIPLAAERGWAQTYGGIKKH